MYGWQVFMGGWLVALMIWAVLLRFYKGMFPELPELITEKHYHDIGKLCFAFTAFWGYITFSQFLIIWYGNLAEETHFFTLRLTGVWKTTTMAAALLTFIVPFFGLLSVKAKTFSPTMILFATSSFLGLWFARYTEIYPSIYGTKVDHLPFGFWEIGIFAGFAGLFAWSYAQFMDAFPKAQVFKMTSPYRDEVQVPVDPETMGAAAGARVGLVFGGGRGALRCGGAPFCFLPRLLNGSTTEGTEGTEGAQRTATALPQGHRVHRGLD